MSDLSKMNSLMNKLADDKFEYGKNDCFTFTNALVKQWHGKSFLDLHNKYNNAKTAKEYMEANNGIEALTTGTLGYSIPPVKCKNGDVVTADVGDGVALGFVFNGNGLFKTKKSACKIPLSKCRHGWSIK